MHVHSVLSRHFFFAFTFLSFLFSLWTSGESSHIVVLRESESSEQELEYSNFYYQAVLQNLSANTTVTQFSSMGDYLELFWTRTSEGSWLSERGDGHNSGVTAIDYQGTIQYGGGNSSPLYSEISPFRPPSNEAHPPHTCIARYLFGHSETYPAASVYSSKRSTHFSAPASGGVQASWSGCTKERGDAMADTSSVSKYYPTSGTSWFTSLITTSHWPSCVAAQNCPQAPTSPLARSPESLPYSIRTDGLTTWRAMSLTLSDDEDFLYVAAVPVTAQTTGDGGYQAPRVGALFVLRADTGGPLWTHPIPLYPSGGTGASASTSTPFPYASAPGIRWTAAGGTSTVCGAQACPAPVLAYPSAALRTGPERRLVVTLGLVHLLDPQPGVAPACQVDPSPLGSTVLLMQLPNTPLDSAATPKHCGAPGATCSSPPSLPSLLQWGCELQETVHPPTTPPAASYSPCDGNCLYLIESAPTTFRPSEFDLQAYMYYGGDEWRYTGVPGMWGFFLLRGGSVLSFWWSFSVFSTPPGTPPSSLPKCWDVTRWALPLAYKPHGSSPPFPNPGKVPHGAWATAGIGPSGSKGGAPATIGHMTLSTVAYPMDSWTSQGQRIPNPPMLLSTRLYLSFPPGTIEVPNDTPPLKSTSGGVFAVSPFPLTLDKYGNAPPETQYPPTLRTIYAASSVAVATPVTPVLLPAPGTSLSAPTRGGDGAAPEGAPGSREGGRPVLNATRPVLVPRGAGFTPDYSPKRPNLLSIPNVTTRGVPTHEGGGSAAVVGVVDENVAPEPMGELYAIDMDHPAPPGAIKVSAKMSGREKGAPAEVRYQGYNLDVDTEALPFAAPVLILQRPSGETTSLATADDSSNHFTYDSPIYPPKMRASSLGGGGAGPGSTASRMQTDGGVLYFPLPPPKRPLELLSAPPVLYSPAKKRRAAKPGSGGAEEGGEGKDQGQAEGTVALDDEERTAEEVYAKLYASEEEPEKEAKVQGLSVPALAYWPLRECISIGTRDGEVLVLDVSDLWADVSGNGVQEDSSALEELKLPPLQPWGTSLGPQGGPAKIPLPTNRTEDEKGEEGRTEEEDGGGDAGKPEEPVDGGGSVGEEWEDSEDNHGQEEGNIPDEIEEFKASSKQEVEGAQVSSPSITTAPTPLRSGPTSFLRSLARYLQNNPPPPSPVPPETTDDGKGGGGGGLAPAEPPPAAESSVPSKDTSTAPSGAGGIPDGGDGQSSESPPPPPSASNGLGVPSFPGPPPTPPRARILMHVRIPSLFTPMSRTVAQTALSPFTVRSGPVTDGLSARLALALQDGSVVTIPIEGHEISWVAGAWTIKEKQSAESLPPAVAGGPTQYVAVSPLQLDILVDRAGTVWVTSHWNSVPASDGGKIAKAITRVTPLASGVCLVSGISRNKGGRRVPGKAGLPFAVVGFGITAIFLLGLLIEALVLWWKQTFRPWWKQRGRV